MSSLIPHFEYDIFISYRHNDNRSGWVTEFVKALQEELASTIKEPVSIYFDTNPHDGLLETHNVDKSLEGKLKCLIFIPIISQTYCDTKSFAWQHEFCVFNRLSNEDKFGRDIKLGNGNVSSRILPIKIHDLDGEDLTTIENELGSPLRPVEFIFRSAGVNRPLATSDNPDKNLSKTFYRDQINKVANGVKELMVGLKYLENSSGVAAIKSIARSPKPIIKVDYGRMVRIGSITILVILIAGYILINLGKLIGLSSDEQIPLHKLIFPLVVLGIAAFVARQPARKMGYSLMQLSAVSVFWGGLADIFYTFTNSTVPGQHMEFLHIDAGNISSDFVSLDFALLRTLGTALISVGIGCWFLLQTLAKQRSKTILIAFVMMVTIAEGNNSIQMYTLSMPFYIYSIMIALTTWIGAILWWKGDPPASSLSQEVD